MFKKIYRGTPKGGSVEKQIMAYTEIKYEENLLQRILKETILS